MGSEVPQRLQNNPFWGRWWLENIVNNKVFIHFEENVMSRPSKNIINNTVFARGAFINKVNNYVFAKSLFKNIVKN